MKMDRVSLRKANHPGAEAYPDRSMRIVELTPKPDWTLTIVSDDGRVGIFNVAPYLEFEAFAELKDNNGSVHLRLGFVPIMASQTANGRRGQAKLSY